MILTIATMIERAILVIERALTNISFGSSATMP
jgi:hypothetical protein